MIKLSSNLTLKWFKLRHLPCNKSLLFSVQLPIAEIISDGTIDGPDINPIHKIREILTDDTSMAKPETTILEWSEFYQKQQSNLGWRLGRFVGQLMKSLALMLSRKLVTTLKQEFVNRQTGLYEMVLFRSSFLKMKFTLSLKTRLRIYTWSAWIVMTLWINWMSHITIVSASKTQLSQFMKMAQFNDGQNKCWIYWISIFYEYAKCWN